MSQLNVHYVVYMYYNTVILWSKSAVYDVPFVVISLKSVFCTFMYTHTFEQFVFDFILGVGEGRPGQKSLYCRTYQKSMCVHVRV